MKQRLNRLLVVGTSGSGKSTLARAAAARLGLPFVASDDYWWEPAWQPASPDAIYAEVANVARQPAWVLESNFDSHRDLLWRRADLVVWLDYQRHVVLSRVARRNIRWALQGAEVWSGNRMTMRRAWSGTRHAMRSYSEKRRNYPQWLAECAPRYVRFGHPRDADQWLRELPCVPQTPRLKPHLGRTSATDEAGAYTVRQSPTGTSD